MLRNIILLLIALLFLYFSANEFKEIVETGCVRAKFGLMLCDWTKYVWASWGGIVASVCLWTVFRRNNIPLEPHK
jgi:hypothetical protein